MITRREPDPLLGALAILKPLKQLRELVLEINNDKNSEFSSIGRSQSLKAGFNSTPAVYSAYASSTVSDHVK